MIKVTRLAMPPRLDPADKQSLGYKELVKASSLISKGKKLPKNIFQAYAHEEVREQLRTMFNRKCAYCESSISGSQDTDVEHYRPKKKVADAEEVGVKHPGYWWLAMDWENLVLSCMHCNQSRKQIVIPPDATVEEIEELLIKFRTSSAATTVGKLDSFPTEDKKWRVGPKDTLTEKPLIIDPTVTDPSDHLEWVFHKDLPITTVKPKDESIIGKTTIDILGLNRRELTRARFSRLSELKVLRNNIMYNYNKAIKAKSGAVAAAYIDSAMSTFQDLKEFAEKECIFSSMANAFVETVIAEIEEVAV